MHLFETVAMETENNFVYTTKDWTFFYILWIISDVESVNILKLNSSSFSKRRQLKNDRVHNLTQNFNQTPPGVCYIFRGFFE